MTQHTQWIPVSAEGAEQSPGFRCDGCGQVKWQAEPPLEACDICAEFVPARETFAPPADPVREDRAAADREVVESLRVDASVINEPSKASQPRRPRNPGLTKETE